MQNKINSQQILVVERHINKIDRHKSLNKYLIKHDTSKKLKTQLSDCLQNSTQKESNKHVLHIFDFQTTQKGYKSQLINNNSSIKNHSFNINNLSKSVKRQQVFQKKNNLKLLWEKTQRKTLKKIFNQKLQYINSQEIKSNFHSHQVQPQNFIKLINKVNITLNTQNDQQCLLKSKKNTSTITKSKGDIKATDLSPYTMFGEVFIPKTQLKTSKLSTKRHKLFQDTQIFNPERQVVIKNALQKMRLKYSTLNEVEFEQLVSINTIKQNQHPGPALKKQRKQILLSISQTIKKNSNFNTNPQKINKDPLNINSMKKNDLETNCNDLDNDKVYKKKIISFLEFVIKVNYSNRIYKEIKLSEKYQNIKRHKVYVGPGNNKFLIVGLLKRRFWIQVVDKITSQVQFFWTQNSLNQMHKKQPSLAKIKTMQKLQQFKLQQNIQFTVKLQPNKSILQNENSSQKTLTNLKHSQSLSNNIQALPKRKNKQIQFRLKTYSTKRQKIKMQSKKSIYNGKLLINKKTQQKMQNICEAKIIRIMNVNVNGKRKMQEIQAPFFQQPRNIITNHIPSNSYIGSKKALFYTMEFYYTHIKNTNPFDIIPKTYHIHSNQQSYNNFIQKEKHIPNSIWIVKPGQCTNRGNGIFLIKNSEIISNNFLNLKKQYHKNGQQKTMIVQHYIKNPLLYYGRKFDIRHYMMVTIVNGNLKAYWYQQGYVRTCSQLFTLSNLDNIYIHLTNDAVQKNSQLYGKYQPGNKVSYLQFQRYLQNQLNCSSSNTNPANNANLNKSTRKAAKLDFSINFKQNIINKMKQIAIDVIKANYLNLDKNRRQNNFQVFGMDFMIDAKFKVWLIQINSNPCLELSCPLLSRIIPTMIENTLRLGLDPLLIPQTHYPPNKRYYISDNILQNLKYQIIFDQLQESLFDKKQLIKKLQQFLLKKGELILKQQNSQTQTQTQILGDFYQNQGKQIELNQIQPQFYQQQKLKDQRQK